MKTLRLIIVLAGAFVLGIAATLLVVRRSAHAPAAAPSAGKPVLYWYDPMAPQQHFAAPGKSPYMDMPLVPKYADDAGSDPDTVRIDPRQTQNLGVRTAAAERGTLTRPVRATGTLAFDQRAVSVVQSRVAGIVEKLWVRAALSPVTQGQPLVTLIAPDWTAAQEEYLSLRKAGAEGLDPLRAAARQRLALLGMDEAQIRAVERSGRAQTKITIGAPRSGVITELAAREGASVAAGAPLLTVTGNDDVWMNAALAEADSGRVAAGAGVTATLPAYPGTRFTGTVETLLPDIDPATRTRIARVVLPNPGGRLAPGMFATVEITPPAPAADSVLIPSEAVIATGTRHVVIVDDGQGRFRAQEVRIGDEAGGRSAVLEGVREGERVVLSGQFLIDSEATLSGALARLGGGTAPQAPANPPADGTRQHATGVVRAIDGARWTIDTDPVAALDMGAMTMTFTLAPSSAPAGAIRSGQRVGFDFVRKPDGSFEIVAIASPDAAAHAEHRP